MIKKYKISHYDGKLYIYPENKSFNDQTAIYISRDAFQDNFGIDMKDLDENNIQHHLAIEHLNKLLKEQK